MIDAIPKDTGNGYLLKGPSAFPSTYTAFRTAVLAGTLPLDINYNSSGWQVEGTALSKANILSDTVAQSIQTIAGASTTPSTPNDAFSDIADAVSLCISGKATIETVTYKGTGVAGSSNKCVVTFSSEPKFLVVHPVTFGDNTGVTNDLCESYEILQYTTLIPVWKLIEFGGKSTRTNAMTFGVRLGTSTTYKNYMYVSNGNKTISWYNTASNAAGQLNDSNYYYAITAFY